MKKDKNPYTGHFENFDDLITAVAKLPTTISYLKVESSYGHFSPGQIKITEIEDSKKLSERVRNIIEEGVHQDSYYLNNKDKRPELVIDEYRLEAHCGPAMPETDSYYIMCSSPSHRDFGRRMSNGDFGPLD